VSQLETDPLPAGADAPRRADARRNQERVFAAALEVFDEHGLQGTIPQVAERARVGKATVYRSYPTKDDLVDAVARYRLAALERSTAPALAEADPFRAFSEFVLLLFASLARDRLLCEVFAERQAETDRVMAQVAALMEAAKASGRVRTDATVLDLSVVLCGIVLQLMDIGDRDPALWHRYGELTLRALRPD
jgi:AcrR family transcriptional regulator